MTLRSRRILSLLAAATFLIVVPPLLLYTTGYRISRDFSITKTGGIYISSPKSGSEIFLNNKLKKKTNILQSGIFIQNLKPKTYSVLVGKEGYWPWHKNLEVREQFVTEAAAFLVKRNPKGNAILKGAFINMHASLYNKVLMFEEKTSSLSSLKKISFYLPEKDEFLTKDSLKTRNALSFYGSISGIKWEKNGVVFKTEKGAVRAKFNFDDRTVDAFYAAPDSAKFKLEDSYAKTKKHVKIWHDSDNIIWVDWLDKTYTPPYYLCGFGDCVFPKQVFNSRFPIKNIDFFPHRRDVIIAAIGNGVYAMELDDRGGRMLQPIYKGKNPNFGVFQDKEKIYILDEGNLLEIEL
jgi:hypothetical protein